MTNERLSAEEMLKPYIGKIDRLDIEYVVPSHAITAMHDYAAQQTASLEAEVKRLEEREELLETALIDLKSRSCRLVEKCAILIKQIRRCISTYKPRTAINNIQEAITNYEKQE